MHKGKRKKKWLIGLELLLLVVFCVAAYQLITYYLTGSREENEFRQLALIAQETASSTDTENSAQQEPAAVNSEILYEQNPDYYGWIRIDGTKIDYPVMYTPGDSEYYLHRAFDRSYSQSGVPFLEGAYTDTCNNYLIYGHNMKNGTMFSSLLSYEKESYWQQHPVVTFDTRDDSGTYDVLGVFYTEIAADRDDVFDYYHYLDLSDPDRYDEYVRKVKENALYDTGIDAAYGDQLLTLSTCSYHVDNGRFVLVARKRSTEE